MFQKLVAVLESMDKNGNGDQDDAVNSPIKSPGYPGKAKHRPQSMGEHGPDPIDLTSGNGVFPPPPKAGTRSTLTRRIRAICVLAGNTCTSRPMSKYAAKSPLDERGWLISIGSVYFSRLGDLQWP